MKLCFERIAHTECCDNVVSSLDKVIEAAFKYADGSEDNKFIIGVFRRS